MKKEKDFIPTISIIIPVYNSFKLISRCINSLEQQTKKNFEVIFIDDCSTDGSYELLNEKLKKYTFNYQVIKNEKNSGPGITRNNGIKKCNGIYVTFVDSDDYVDKTFIEQLTNIIEKQESDIIIFDYYIETNNKYKVCAGLPLKEEHVATMDALALTKGMCWGKVYKKSIIIDNNITFPNLIRSEDIAFCKAFISKCSKVYYIQEPLYYYIENNQSIMHTRATMNTLNNKKAFDYIEQNAGTNEAVEMIFVREYLYLIVQIMTLKKCSTKEIKKFIDECGNKYTNWYKNVYIKYQPLYVKIILVLIKYKIIFPIRMIFKLKK